MAESADAELRRTSERLSAAKSELAAMADKLRESDKRSKDFLEKVCLPFIRVTSKGNSLGKSAGKRKNQFSHPSKCFSKL
jgi:hypothetical protein